MIIDAGGGTVDLTTCKFTAVHPIAVEEIAPPDCELIWLRLFTIKTYSSLA